MTAYNIDRKPKFKCHVICHKNGSGLCLLWNNACINVYILQKDISKDKKP